MKLLLPFILKIMFVSAFAHAIDPKCDDHGKVYKVCQDQKLAFEEALAKATADKKTLLVLAGAEWCPWCISLDRMLTDPDFGQGFMRKNFSLRSIALFQGKEKIPGGQSVIEKIKKMAKFEKKIEGIPILAALNPVNGKAVLIDTEPLEKNVGSVKGHDPEKVLLALKKAQKALN